jgi:MFS family permease
MSSTTRSRFSVSVAIAVGVAAAAMVATLPGRTHGLGMVTEPLMKEFGIDRVPFAALNFWATLIGSVFCIPAGWAVDRFGLRATLSVVSLALGAVVIVLAKVSTGSSGIDLPSAELFFGGGLEWSPVPLDLFLLVLLTRGLGQSALSVISLSLVGKVAGKKPGWVIGCYSFLVSIGFMAAFVALGPAFKNNDWRTVWAAIGWTVVGFAVISLLVVREPRTAPLEDQQATDLESNSERSLTLSTALRTPTFWLFAIATSYFGLVSSGQTLFSESLLAERGFSRDVYFDMLKFGVPFGLVANLATGFFATRIRLNWLLAIGMLLMGGSLAAFPRVTSLTQVYVYTGGMAAAGGVVTVLFFTIWRQAYGPAHLGKIQAPAQLLTVVASSVGPLIFAAGQRAFGLYAPVMQNFAIVAGVIAVAAILVPLPRKELTQSKS